MRRSLVAGEQFGEWTLLRYEGRRPSGNHTWLGRCSCGKERVLQHSNLVSGQSTNCGCRAGTHRKSKTPEYRAWICMRNRCYSVDHRDYPRWGGRGIRVCATWQRSFETFFADMGPRPGRGYSLDRIDNDGDYEPDNCRWATQAEQNANRRCSR